MENKNKVWVHVRGDMSVGIQDVSVWIDMPGIDNLEDDEKEFVREQLTICFENIYDSQADVYMSENEVSQW